MNISTITPGHGANTATAPTLEGLRDALIAESFDTTCDLAAFEDQVEAAYPSGDYDGEIRPVTRELLAELASRVWDCPVKHVTITN